LIPAIIRINMNINNQNNRKDQQINKHKENTCNLKFSSIDLLILETIKELSVAEDTIQILVKNFICANNAKDYLIKFKEIKN
jgi:hypothetical protein